MYNLNKDSSSRVRSISPRTQFVWGKRITVSSFDRALLLCTSNTCQQHEAGQNLFTLQSNSSHQDNTLYSILVFDGRQVIAGLLQD